jgi:hypothetical protein
MGAAGTSGGVDSGVDSGIDATAGSTGADAGTGGAGGAMPIPITCGQQTCAPGAQTCCIQVAGGVASESCVATGTSCPGGVSIGCLDGAACSGGTVCCLSFLGASTACQPPIACAGGFGLVLCASDGDCPTASPQCCRAGRSGFCSAGACF